MSQSGTKSPPNSFPKKGAETKLSQSTGSKCLKEQMLSPGEPADIGPAPAHRRLYTRDYSKVRPSADDTDLVTEALGNPLKF
ncbi:MAG TPA: hypothetical protein VIJ38_02130 [Acidobacteriaceae bacterium]